MNRAKKHPHAALFQSTQKLKESAPKKQQENEQNKLEIKNISEAIAKKLQSKETLNKATEILKEWLENSK